VTCYFEDLEPGLELRTAERTVGERDVLAFAELSGDHNPIHVDEAAARRAGFDGRVAHGALGIALATGLVSESGLTRESLIALVGLSWRFSAPVRIGDTVHARVRVTGRRATSRADRGVVILAVEVVDGAGRVVQQGELTELVRRRPP
jgi:acyl dehydratase